MICLSGISPCIILVIFLVRIFIEYLLALCKGKKPGKVGVT